MTVWACDLNRPFASLLATEAQHVHLLIALRDDLIGYVDRRVADVARKELVVHNPLTNTGTVAVKGVSSVAYVRVRS
jgi:hypothetical protein